MASNIFPTTPNLSWSVIKAPNWATRMQRAVPGRELRTNDYVLPFYTFTLTYEVIRDPWDQRMGYGTGPAFKPPSGSAPLDELRSILEFFNQQWGASIPFQFFDYSDNTTRADSSLPQSVYFGTGDGTTVTFQPASELMAPVFPTVVNSVTPALSYTIDPDTGLITFASAPGMGSAVGADMTYNYRVRFAKDLLEAENFAWQFWQMKSLQLVSVPY